MEQEQDTREISRSKAALETFRAQAWKNSIAARKGKPLSAEHKAKLSDSHLKTRLERPAARKVPLWAIAEDALLGLTSTASAEKLNGWQADVYRQRKRMGLATSYPGVVRHGEVLAFRHFEEFCKDLGVTKKEAASFAGLSYRGFANRILKKGRETPLSGRNPSDPSVPHVGRNLNEALQKAVVRFCYVRRKRWTIRRFLTSEFRDIRAKHPVLQRAAAQLREAFKAGGITANSESALEWVCRNCIDRHEADLRTMLFFGLTLRDLLNRKPDRLFGDNFRSEEFATELLALDYGAAPNAIAEVVAGDVKPLDPETLRSSSLEFVQRKATLPTPKSRGKKKFSDRLVEKGEFCDRVIADARKVKRLCVDGGKTVAEIWTQHPGLAIWQVREELSEEDRETFNHPRQWGPVVGYAEMILGKQQGKSDSTIREWVKAYRRSKRTS